MEQGTGVGPLCLYPRSAAAFCGCILKIGLMHYTACAPAFDSDTQPNSIKKVPARGTLFMEQGTGVEPALTAWEAAVIPIYQPCVFGCSFILVQTHGKCKQNVLRGRIFRSSSFGFFRVTKECRLLFVSGRHHSALLYYRPNFTMLSKLTFRQSNGSLP